MNKTEFVQKLAKVADLSQVKAAQVVYHLFDGRKGIIAVELNKGRKVSIPGFGSFISRHRKARMSRNPQSGADVPVPAKSYPAFKAGKTLKERVAK